ncbi:MAG: hypothetical protein WC503_04125 [Candidatus Shapirobacteria bacterium]
MWVCFILLATVVLGYTYLRQIDGVYVNKPIVFTYWDGNIITHQTTKLVYHPGEIVYAKIIAHKDKLWPAIIQWNLVNGCFHSYQSKDETLEAGRTERITKIEQIPIDIKPGEDYFYGSVTFDLNFVKRKIHIPIRTNTFLIEPLEKK